MQLSSPSPSVFNALLSGNISDILSTSEESLRPFLPSLARMVLCPPVQVAPSDPSTGMPLEWAAHGLNDQQRKLVHIHIAGIGEVNPIRSYLGLNFDELRQDAMKEQQLLRKLGPEDRGQSILASSLQFGLAIEFERSNHLRRFRLFLSEVLKLLGLGGAGGGVRFRLEQSDMFECEAHVEEVCDIMCVAAAELPTLLPVVKLSEALLRLRNGPQLLCRLIANMPDHFDQVVTYLVVNGEVLDDVTLSGRCRTTALRLLCAMHPSKAGYVQMLAVQSCKHPSLALSLALEAEEWVRSEGGCGLEPDRQQDLVAKSDGYVGGAGVMALLHTVIIAGDDQTKAWFLQYLKCMQQRFRRRKNSAVTRLRAYILKKLRSFYSPPSASSTLQEDVWGAGPQSEEDIARSVGTTKLQEGGEMMETTESSSLVIQTPTGGSSGGHIVLEEGASVAISSSSETLEELVDQMEIEISDHEGDADDDKDTSEESEEDLEKLKGVVSGVEGGAITIGKVRAAGGGGGGGGAGEVVSEKIEVSTELSTRRRREGSSMTTDEEKGVVFVRRRRWSSTHEDFPLISQDRQLNNDQIVELMELLQVCSSLKIQCQMYLLEEEAVAILGHILCTCPPFSAAGVRFIQVALCILLACPFLISVDGCEDVVVRWFQWLLQNLPVFDQACAGAHCSYGELLLLVSIHLREKNLDQIEKLLVDTLNMKASSYLKSSLFGTISALYLKVFTEEVMSTHAVSVPPTRDLCGDMKGYLPIHCIHQLIKMKNFRKYNISIKDWIYKQLLVVSEPLHPSFPPLLQEFVDSVLVSPITSSPKISLSAGGRASAKNHTPFSAEEVLSVFRRDESSYDCLYPLPAQVLMLYYVVLYQDTYHNNLRAILSLPGDSAPCGYSPNVLTKIPVKYLLNHAHSYQSRYRTLYPTLLKLTSVQFPQLCLVCEWVTEQRDMLMFTAADSCKGLKIAKSKMTPENCLTVLQGVCERPSQSLLVLRQLCSLPPTSLVPYCHALTSTLPLLLQSPAVPRSVMTHFVTLWTKLNTIVPRRLWLDTVNALRPKELRAMALYTEEDIARDPLIPLRCDARVFRCPPIFDLLLRYLAAYMAAASTFLHDQVRLQNCTAMARVGVTGSSNATTKQEREELCVALNATQSSTMVQLLLEICLTTDQDKEMESKFGGQLSALREIQCLVCSFLHHTFICEPSLAKLVHFQGYPPELVPMMVSGVPSMHICLDFIPELLSQPHPEKQIFGIQLAAHVINQYPVPEAMGTAKSILQQVTVLAGELVGTSRDSYYISILPSLALLCRTFPPLCSEVTAFLVHLSKISRPLSHAPSSGPMIRSKGGGALSEEGVVLAVTIEDTFQEIIACIAK